MVSISLEYQGDLHCRAVHGPSGTELATDAPLDNQGRGESFSPTDLVATGLASCILTTMAIMARTLNVDITGATATVTKEMTSSPPRSIRRLATTVSVPQTLEPEIRLRLERAAHTCPVHRSLHPDVEKPIDITWG